jgi:hypothetical protein
METTKNLKALAAKQSTDTLLAACALLDAQETTDAAERMTRAAMADVIEERHNLGDAMDAIFDENFSGTYTEALVLALAKVSA